MSTIPKIRLEPEQRILLTGIPWKTYAHLVRLYEDRPGPRMTYDRGDLELMSPSFRHESLADVLGHFVVVLTEEFGLPRASGGCVTMKLKVLKRGLEADRSFWIAHEAQVRGLEKLDLRIHPPPDLALEVEVTKSALPRMAIYAKLRVPEVWRLSRKRLRFQQLQANGKFKDVTHSVAFPQITAADLMTFLDLARTTEANALVAQFRQWVRQRLGPPATA